MSRDFSVRLLRSFLIFSTVIAVMLSTLVSASVANHSEFPDELPTASYNSSTMSYGLDMSEFLVETSVIKPGQTLSTLLQPYQMKASMIFRAVEKSKKIFDGSWGQTLILD